MAGIADGKYEAKGGTSGDIIITVWDSLKNKSELTLEGITLDGNTPGIDNLFPTDKTAPKDADNEDARSVRPDHQESGLPDQRRARFAVHSLS